MFGALLMRVNDLHVLDSNSESRPQNDLSVHNVNAHILIDIGRSKLYFARRDKLHCNSESQESIVTLPSASTSPAVIAMLYCATTMVSSVMQEVSALQPIKL